MLWLWIILGILILLVMVVLFSPVVIDVDSEEDRYVVRYGWWVIGSLRAIDGDLAVRLRIFGFTWQKRIEDLVLSMRGKSKPETEETPTPARAPRKGGLRKMSWRKIKAVWRAIEFKKLELDLDTGSYVRNAWLFPLFFMISRKNRKMRINFSGKNIVHAYVRAVPARLLWAFVRT